MAEKKAEKTAKKSTSAKAATGTKTTAAKKSAAAKKTTAAAPRAAATVTAARPAVRKTVTTRRRAAATVPHSAAATQSVTGWRRFRRKTKVGVVVSAKQARTVIVTVERQREHPLYKKVVRVRKRFAAHDDAGDVREGDLVRIQESRPYSATKRWRVVEVISRLGEADASAPPVVCHGNTPRESGGARRLPTKHNERVRANTW